jgi:hypothetical protein
MRGYRRTSICDGAVGGAGQIANGGILQFVFGPSLRSLRRNSLSAIGGMADIGGFWPEMVCPLMTHSGHPASRGNPDRCL